VALISEDALVLRAFSYSETSKILRLLTPGHGVVGVIARGARRPKSPYGGLLEPFTEGIATFQFRSQRDLHNLVGFELVHSGQRVATDLLRFGGASVLAELVLETASGEADTALFGQLRDALRRVAVAPADTLEPTLLAEAWALVTRLGFAPALDDCLICGRTVEPSEDAWMDYPGGGIRCLDCGDPGAGRSLPATARAALRRLCAGRHVEVPRTAAHWDLLSRFLAFHVLEGRGLRSLPFLQGSLADRPDSPATR
jgi:DNA repair protein RecO (recombination protein O)